MDTTSWICCLWGRKPYDCWDRNCETIRPEYWTMTSRQSPLRGDKSPNEELEGIFISDIELRPSSMASSFEGQLLIRRTGHPLQLKQGTMHFGNTEGGSNNRFWGIPIPVSSSSVGWFTKSKSLGRFHYRSNSSGWIFWRASEKVGTSTWIYDTDGCLALLWHRSRLAW